MIDDLIAALNDSRKSEVRKAADALIACLENVPGLPAKLEGLLRSAAEKSRWPVAYILGHVPQPPEVCIEVLLDNLGHLDPDVRWAVLLLLVRLAKEHAGVVEKLIRLLRSGTATQRRMAVYCLRDLQLEESAKLAALSGACDDSEPEVRIAAITSLRSLAGLSEPVANQLLRLLARDADLRVRCAAATILGQVGPISQDVRDALQDTGESPDPQLRKAAQAAMALIKKREPAPAGK